jgi:hypothetical protein
MPDDPRTTVIVTPDPAPPAQPTTLAQPATEEPKTVPLEALLAERAKAKNDREQLEGQLQQVQGYLQQLAPHLAYLQAHPNLLSEPPPPSVAEEPDPELAEFARTLDLYTADAKPDVKRAEKMLRVVGKRLEPVVQQAIAPVAQVAATQKSEANFQRALAVRDPAGRAPNPETLKQMWQAMPPAYTADERIAAVVAYAAMGYDRVHGAPPAIAPSTEPVVTEAVGSPPSPRAPLSEFERRIAAGRNLDETKWGQLTTGYTRGKPSVVED